MLAPSAQADSGIVNGGFEAGTFSGWTTSGAATSIVSSGCHSGTYCAQAGSTSPTNGDSSISQTFTAPAGTTGLSLWYKMICPDTVTYDWATVTLTDNTTNTTTTVVPQTCNPFVWTNATAAVSAGTSYTLTLTNHDDNVVGDATYTLFDDVALTPVVVNDFSMGASPNTVTVEPGASGESTISTVAIGSAGTVALSASGLPAGSTATFNPTSVTAGGSSTLTLDSGTAAAGTYTVTITGTEGTKSHSTTVTFTINPAGDFGISASPTTVTVGSGASGESTISTVAIGSAGTVALSVSGLPAGSTATFTPTSVTAGGSSTLTLNSGTAAAGSYTVTISGTEGTATHTTTVTFTINQVPPCSRAVGKGTFGKTGVVGRLQVQNELDASLQGRQRLQVGYIEESGKISFRLLKLEQATCSGFPGERVFAGSGPAAKGTEKGYTFSFSIREEKGGFYFKGELKKGALLVEPMGGPLKTTSEKIG
jgi:hypothetical protein